MSSYQKNITNDSFNHQKQEQSNKQMKQLYLCSCGKQYLSFPAIYLHFRVKHRIKLSTRPTQYRRSQYVENQTRIFKYSADFSLLFQNQQHQQEISFRRQFFADEAENGDQLIEEIQQCIAKYIKNEKISLSTLYRDLVKFFKQNKKKIISLRIPMNVSKIPYFLNDFTLKFLPKCGNSMEIGSKLWTQCCQQLYNFCTWLRKQKYTQLLVYYEIASNLNI